ncbi:hypothetical protein DCS_07541 [Drechmeria coniospora]|uniref:Uncharacterized protein n=1 Tax=Drechmeria coniospora TaxID=98403 RepID=A0A151GER4_DRECN|nr:hypothetical protein DCS_07541 [Drechmeria coniospora]KYK55578.1 hypothetical protein DCS_07541 [Drechmeria coniospora]
MIDCGSSPRRTIPYASTSSHRTEYASTPSRRTPAPHRAVRQHPITPYASTPSHRTCASTPSYRTQAPPSYCAQVPPIVPYASTPIAPYASTPPLPSYRAHPILPYSTAQGGTVRHRTAPCHAMPYCTMPYCTVPCHTVPYRAMPSMPCRTYQTVPCLPAVAASSSCLIPSSCPNLRCLVGAHVQRYLPVIDGASSCLILDLHAVAPLAVRRCAVPFARLAVVLALFRRHIARRWPGRTGLAWAGLDARPLDRSTLVGPSLEPPSSGSTAPSCPGPHWTAPDRAGPTALRCLSVTDVAVSPVGSSLVRPPSTTWPSTPPLLFCLPRSAFTTRLPRRRLPHRRFLFSSSSVPFLPFLPSLHSLLSAPLAPARRRRLLGRGKSAPRTCVGPCRESTARRRSDPNRSNPPPSSLAATRCRRRRRQAVSSASPPRTRLGRRSNPSCSHGSGWISLLRSSPLLPPPLLSSPLLSSPLLSSPLLSSPLLSSPLLSSPLLSSPLLSSPLLSSPHLASPRLSSPLLSVPLRFSEP